jgi:SpoVK/Ycf46/Vps4 family AAA+-type ATPase
MIADARMNGFSGADIAALVREATLSAIHQALPENVAEEAGGVSRDAPQQPHDDGDDASDSKFMDGIVLKKKHFEVAFTKVFPSVSKKDAERYETVRKTIRSSHIS